MADEKLDIDNSNDSSINKLRRLEYPVSKWWSYCSHLTLGLLFKIFGLGVPFGGN